MSRSRLVVIGAVVSIVAAFGVAPVAQAQEDYFLAVQNGSSRFPVVGETTDAVYAKQMAIDISSFGWSAENPVTVGSATGGAGGGRAKLNELTVEKRVDSASPALFQRLVTGQEIPRMDLFVRRAGQAAAQGAYLTYTFGSVFVTSVSPSGDGEQMRERVTFAYGQVRQSYRRQTVDGRLVTTPLVSAWDQVLNQEPPPAP